MRLSVPSEVQIVCIWCSRCHCHPKTPSSLASFKSILVLPFWYWLTQVVLEKRPLNRCSNSSSSINSSLKIKPTTKALFSIVNRSAVGQPALSSIYCDRTRVHFHVRHCSSAASAVCRLQSAVHIATPAFDVQSPSLLCGWSGSLELITRLLTRADTLL